MSQQRAGSKSETGRFAIKRLNLPSEFYPKILFCCLLKAWMLPCSKWLKGKKTLSRQCFKIALPDKQKPHQPLYERKDRQSNKLSWISYLNNERKKKSYRVGNFFFAIILDKLLYWTSSWLCLTFCLLLEQPMVSLTQLLFRPGLRGFGRPRERGNVGLTTPAQIQGSVSPGSYPISSFKGYEWLKPRSHFCTDG